MNNYACISSEFQATIRATSNGAGYPIVFSISGGSLPAGLSIGTTSDREVTIVGTPTTIGSSTFTITATAPNNATTSRAYTIEVIGITMASPLSATLNTIYSETLAVSGMAGTLIWGIASGSLPSGLILNSATGEITGIPDTEETATFTVFVQNETQQCLKEFEVGVAECFLTVSPLAGGDESVAYSQSLTPGGDLQPGYQFVFSLASGSLPAGLSLNGSTGEISGTPTESGDFTFTVQLSQAPI